MIRKTIEVKIKDYIALSAELFSNEYKGYDYSIDNNILTLKIEKAVLYQKWKTIFENVTIGQETFGDKKVIVLFIDQKEKKKKISLSTSEKINSLSLVAESINRQYPIGPKVTVINLKHIQIPPGSVTAYLCCRDNCIEYTGVNSLLTYLYGKQV